MEASVLMTARGTHLVHLTGEESVDELVAVVTRLGSDMYSCDRENRAAVRRVLSEAANRVYGTTVYRTRTSRSPVDGVSIAWVEIDHDRDPVEAAAEQSRSDERMYEQARALI